MAVNQVIVGDEVKLDLTTDTVSENNLLAGATAHNAAGEPITGAVVVAPIDSELSETSENPVQNKAIFAALSEKASSSHSHSVADISDFPEIPTGGGIRIITGSYIGDGSNGVKQDEYEAGSSKIDAYTINIGARPKIVIIQQLQKSNNNWSASSLKNTIIDGFTDYQYANMYIVGKIVDNGFIVGGDMVETNYTYKYAALVEV